MKFPKSILIAVTLGDLGDSKLMMMCEKHFFKLLDRRFTLEVSLPFRSHWVSPNILPAVQVKLKWGSAFLFILTTFPSASPLSRLTARSSATCFTKAMFRGSGLLPPRPFWRDLDSVHKSLRRGSGFLYLQGVSSQRGSHTRRQVSWGLSGSGVPV